jgi:hypothetical protein
LAIVSQLIIKKSDFLLIKKQNEFMDQLYRINKLIDKIESELGSERNKNICEKWNIPCVQYTYTHSVPKRRDQIPVVADFEFPLWARVLNFNVKEFYTNPLTYLEKQLEMSLYRYNVLNDDSGLGRTIAIWLGVNYEASILGCRSVYPENYDPYTDRSFLIVEDEESLKKFEAKEIDFRNDGILSLAHEFYSRIKEILPSDWNVIFPDWVIGPFGIGIFLRGYQNILFDLEAAPEFFVKMLDIVSNKMIEYSTKRAKFLGVEVEKFNLHNDDVNNLNLSNAVYSKLIFPVENKLSSFYGGFQYWHSCGDVENFIDDILNFKNLKMVDCSGWNNLDLFLDAFNKKGITGIGIEKRFNPVKDIIGADDKSIRERIKGLYDDLERSKGLNINFKIDGIGGTDAFRENSKSVMKFIRISREFGF